MKQRNDVIGIMKAKKQGVSEIKIGASMEFVRRLKHFIKHIIYTPLLLYVKYTMMYYISKRPICLHFWITQNVRMWTWNMPKYNWGDYMNVVLGEMISGRKVIPYDYVMGARKRRIRKYLMLGSIVPWGIIENTEIWGAGYHYKDEEWPPYSGTPIVHAVRGPKTREMLLEHGVKCPEIYGDPVLLLPRYYSASHVTKRYKYGIVYHFLVEKEVLTIKEDIEQKLESVLWINPNQFDNWQEFVDKVCSCEVVLSSSLRGLILADAYHVPNIWIRVSDEEKSHDYFKYHDYFQSIMRDAPAEPYNIRDITVDIIDNNISNYRPPQIDLDLLLDSCPFK